MSLQKTLMLKPVKLKWKSFTIHVVTGSSQGRMISTLLMQNISFTDHILLAKQQNVVICFRKMTKLFKDIKLSNQTKDIRWQKLRCESQTSLNRYRCSFLSAWSCLISTFYFDPNLLLLSLRLLWNDISGSVDGPSRATKGYIWIGYSELTLRELPFWNMFVVIYLVLCFFSYSSYSDIKSNYLLLFVWCSLKYRKWEISFTYISL